MDQDGLGAQIDAGATRRGPDPLAAFADAGLAGAEDFEARRTVLGLNFDNDRAGFNAPEGGGLGVGWIGHGDVGLLAVSVSLLLQGAGYPRGRRPGGKAARPRARQGRLAARPPSGTSRRRQE